MTLSIGSGLLDEIRRHAEAAYPEECCGVLAGEIGEAKRALRAVPMINARDDAPTSRYLIAPDELRRVYATLAEMGLDIVGYYHSHPDVPARPSAFDLEQAWPWYSYLIVAVARGRAGEVASWTLADDRSRFDPERLLITTEVG